MKIREISHGDTLAREQGDVMASIRVHLLIASCGLLMLAAAAAAGSEVERRVPARPDGLVTVSNVAGSVTVVGWNRDEVEVIGYLGHRVEELEIDSSGRVTDIEVELRGRSHGSDSSARLEIRVPQGSDLDIEVVSAEVEVSDVHGDVTIETVSGSIDLEGTSKAADLESVSGSINVEGNFDRLDAESVSGRIRVRGEAREVELSTVSGELELRVDGIRRGDLSTTSGSIELVGKLDARAEIEADSHSGRVELQLPPSTSARFRVSTHSGRISNELGPPAERTSRYGPGRKLEFELGGGDGRITIDTFSGSVSLRRR